MKGDGIFKWYAGRGIDPEGFDISAPSRGEALDMARTKYGDGPDIVFTLMEADTAVPETMDGARLWQDWIAANEMLGDENGEFAEGIEPSEAQLEDLTARFAELFNAWLDRHDLTPGVSKQCGTVRVTEYFGATPEAIAAGHAADGGEA